MSAAIELKIQKLFRESKAAGPVAQSLVKECIQEPNCDETDIQAIATFCLLSGSYKALMQLCIERLATNKSLPWDELARALHYDGLIFDNEVAEALYEGAKEQQALENLAKSLVLDGNFPQLQELREKSRARYYAEHRLKKDQIIDQIEIARTQQLLQEEKRLVDQLSRLFPEEEAGGNQRQLFQERWARDVLSKRSSKVDPTWESEDDALTSEQLEICNNLKKQALELQSQEPELGQDLPSIFLMMEDYSSALELLKAQNSSYGKDWLEVEVLLWMRRFVDALGKVQELETRYAESPDTAFAAAYLKAQALWGLQKKSSALEIMESVVSARPNYRSAHSYLSLWRNGER